MLAISHKITVLSRLPVARVRPSRENASSLTESVWPVKEPANGVVMRLFTRLDRVAGSSWMSRAAMPSRSAVRGSSSMTVLAWPAKFWAVAI